MSVCILSLFNQTCTECTLLYYYFESNKNYCNSVNSVKCSQVWIEKYCFRCNDHLTEVESQIQHVTELTLVSF